MTGVAAMSAMLSSITTTIAITTLSDALRDLGELIGVRVVQGWQFLAITWSMFGVVLLAWVYWTVVYWTERRERRGIGTPEYKAAREGLNDVTKTHATHHRQVQHAMTGEQFIEKAHR